jgi:hypothetical protein
MSIKLTDAQLLMLSAASQRDDQCLERSRSPRGNAAQKLAEKLVSAGLVREIRSKAGAPVWRRDDEAEQSYSLKLTAAGLKAIAVDADEGEGAPTAVAEPAPPTVHNDAENATAADASASGEAPIATAPREGTKIANVIALLQRDQGATLDELIAATNWLPHTARAALTGLRKRGYILERQARAEGGNSYAIVAAASRTAA